MTVVQFPRERTADDALAECAGRFDKVMCLGFEDGDISVECGGGLTIPEAVWLLEEVKLAMLTNGVV